MPVRGFKKKTRSTNPSGAGQVPSEAGHEFTPACPIAGGPAGLQAGLSISRRACPTAGRPARQESAKAEHGDTNEETILKALNNSQKCIIPQTTLISEISQITNSKLSVEIKTK